MIWLFKDGKSPLMYASKVNAVPIIGVLLRKGADPTLTDNVSYLKSDFIKLIYFGWFVVN